jgi:co-chaperonin GroES (HSP10)|tara:strand:- start:83 stop:460 length:378 start_codon:yes stop_codon:yes gene_type:complete
MIEAVYNAIVVQPIELEETTYGNIVVPDLGNEKNKTGKVVHVGPGHYSATGVFIPTMLKAGNIIVLPTMGFSKFEYMGDEYWIGPENQVLAKIVERASIEEVLEQTEVTDKEKEYLTIEDIKTNE